MKGSREASAAGRGKMGEGWGEEWGEGCSEGWGEVTGGTRRKEGQGRTSRCG